MTPQHIECSLRDQVAIRLEVHIFLPKPFISDSTLVWGAFGFLVISRNANLQPYRKSQADAIKSGA